jgi:predicted secreted hydrolase
VIRRLCVFLLCLITTAAYANFPYYPLSFPRDEGAHTTNIPYKFKTLMEWWYINTKATTDDGKQISFDVAIFNPAASQMGHVISQPMLHLQFSDIENKKSVGTGKRYPLNAGKFSTEKLDITVDKDFEFHQVVKNGKPVYVLKAQGQENDAAIELTLEMTPVSPHFLINGNGLMPMANDTNSYYYSIPHFNTTGSITVNGKQYKITQAPADTWLDHQWGDFNVQQNGWEWFSVRLDNGLIANIFLIVEYQHDTVISGLANIILPSGETKFIPYQDFKVTRENFWYDEKNGMTYPTTFNFDFPTLGLKFNNVAAFAEQEVHGYWEGLCYIDAVYQNKASKGFSYTEIVYRSPAN